MIADQWMAVSLESFDGKDSMFIECGMIEYCIVAGLLIAKKIEETIKMSEFEIKELDLSRDGGSFSFLYKNIPYECNIPLYILESNNEPVKDLDLISEMILVFKNELEKDHDFNKLMRCRINELTRYYMILKEINRTS